MARQRVGILQAILNMSRHSSFNRNMHQNHYRPFWHNNQNEQSDNGQGLDGYSGDVSGDADGDAGGFGGGDGG